MKPFALLLLAFALLSAPSRALDLYVDVVNGNDAAAGTNPASAWKTLTHAAAVAPPGPSVVIHVAPGVYSSTTGETFPLAFRMQELVSADGPWNTILDGAGATSVLDMIQTPSSTAPGGLTRLSGFRIYNSGVGIYAFYSWGSLTCTLEDVVFDSCSQGVFATCGSFIGSGSSFHFRLDRVIAAFCGSGLQMSATAGSCSVEAYDSTFSTCGNGVVLSGGAQLSARFERCRFLSNGTYGLWATPVNNGLLDVALADCLVAQNGAGYVTSTSSGHLSTAQVRLTRCTVADNVGTGIVSKSGVAPTFVSTVLDGVLAWGNGVDLDATNVVQNTFSRIGGADPLFRDRTNQDYRVTFASPVIDAGDPATPVGRLDLARNPRSIDGDLDALERADVGAFEFETLETTTSGALSTPLRFDVWGPAGASASLYFARVAPVAPTATPFGEFDLPVGQFGFLLNLPAGPIVPGSFTRTIPPNPLLVGRTFSFQARTTSAAAPNGAAWTNVRAVTFVP